jgi:pSer/pThr/pTyr-binding forkhead associated (FHA) protein
MSGPVVFALRALLAVSLYAFLGWAFFSLWRDIRQQGMLLSTRRVPPIGLTIESEATETRLIHFTVSEVLIGRDPACDCPLEDDAVSARHARLIHHHNQWWLEDLGSMNGVLLNRQKLALPTVVMNGDEFSCGETHFTIALVGGQAPSPTRKLPDRDDED